jgi:hypothetical protein
MSKKRPPTWIDHSKIIDGFDEMRGKTHCENFEATCGRCGTEFVFTAADQKYVHEVRGVPIKHARRGAAFCKACATQQGEANRAQESLVQAVRAAAEAKTAAEGAPGDGKKLADYIDAKLEELRRRWSRRVASLLVGDIRRARVLAQAGEQKRLDAAEAALAKLSRRYPE